MFWVVRADRLPRLFSFHVVGVALHAVLPAVRFEAVRAAHEQSARSQRHQHPDVVLAAFLQTKHRALFAAVKKDASDSVTDYCPACSFTRVGLASKTASMRKSKNQTVTAAHRYSQP
ncbi:hypothetical protein EVAR_8057_1 [Eumeta japonica]|uniref:Uncharacterized protein n=1 Tax=Eumeta variegata TaxID=151549 RepID=A0A4C1TKE5_EUMVA|nr:hypothetical protein EVAR_8057_1 [Eumeta japonica]